MKKYLCSVLILFSFMFSPVYSVVRSFVSLGKIVTFFNGVSKPFTIQLCGDEHVHNADSCSRWFKYAQNLVKNNNFLGLSEASGLDINLTNYVLMNESPEGIEEDKTNANILEKLIYSNDFFSFDIRRGELAYLVDGFMKIERLVLDNRKRMAEVWNNDLSKSLLYNILEKFDKDYSRFENQYNYMAIHLGYMAAILFENDLKIDVFLKNDLCGQAKNAYKDLSDVRRVNNLSSDSIKKTINGCIFYYSGVLKKVCQMKAGDLRSKFGQFIEKTITILNRIKKELYLEEGAALTFLKLLLSDKALILNLKDYFASGPSFEKSMNDCLSLNYFLPLHNKNFDRRHIYLYFLIERLVEVDFICRIIDGIAQGKNVILFAGESHTEVLEKFLKRIGFKVSKKWKSSKVEDCPKFLDDKSRPQF